MAKSLVIVESPTKARTLNRFLGSDVKVVASMGHVRDLPQNRLGVEVNDGFKPSYVLTDSGKKAMATIRREAKGTEAIYLATDHDREGEAIAWHIRQALKDSTKAEFHRVTFHEITQSAIDAAFAEPGSLDIQKVEAQQARRVLDRIVGYQVSPLLWRSIQRGTSAGRVQSVALRLVCERERAIQAFEPEEYWDLIAHFGTDGTEEMLRAKLSRVDGKKPKIGDQKQAAEYGDEIEGAGGFRVADLQEKPRNRKAPPPFITSTLQQTAGSRLGFGTRMTMQVAQQLYEGVELGAEGAAGLITYMRTDSVNIAQEAQQSALAYIRATFGEEYAPKKPNRYRSRGGAQEAHEAIRPTDVARTPERVAPYLDQRQLRLYRLIWRRFVASQMTPARFDEKIVELAPASPDKLGHTYRFRARGSTMVFAGFLKAHGNDTGTASTAQVKKDDKKDDKDEQPIPDWVVKDTNCELRNLERNQCFTKPPQRFSESTLVRELERNGVGRPSTYATIVGTIQQRSYVEKGKGRLYPTDLGFRVYDYLADNLASLFAVDFTARMEKELDEIEEGSQESRQMLEHFYGQFREWLGEAAPPTKPDEDTVRAFLDAFPEDLAWNPPEKRGRRTYDDGKFHRSLREQLDGGKALSDKQWEAALALGTRYLDKVPELADKAREIGVFDQLDAMRKAIKLRERPSGGNGDAPSEASKKQLELLKSFEPVTFVKPVKRGGRQYDDKAFVASLRERVEKGRELTDAQLKAARKLMVKYRDQLPDYDKLAEEFNLAELDNNAEISLPEAKAVLDITKDVDVWSKPVTRGKRTFNDEEFVASLREQVESGKNLSTKQLGALRRLIGRYAGQIPDYAQKAERLGLPLKQASGEGISEPEAPCPYCGSKLVRRKGRKGPFIGCSAFPRCRFTARSPEEVEEKRNQKQDG